MRILLLFLLLSLANNGFTQSGNSYDFSKMTDFLPPSPNAAALGKFGGIGLNYNTGAPNINIPLLSVQGVALKTELSLHYSSSGIKVDEIASRSGMGWYLAASGVINRVVMGVADELSTKRYLPPNATGTTRKFYDAIQNIADYSNSTHGYDGQPDIFSYSFDGYSGRFVFDSLMNIVSIPFNDLKIEKDFSGTDWNFKITTPAGTKFYFGGATATETSKKGSTCGKNFDSFMPTAWYLKRIEHPYGELITFLYTTLTFQYDIGRSESSYTLMTPGGEPTGNFSPSGHCFKSSGAPGNCIISCQTPGTMNCISYVTVNSKLLSQVNTGKATISFSYTSRSDCEDKLIAEIDYVDKLRGAFVNRYYFAYAYYGTNHIPYLARLTKSSADNTTENFYDFSYYAPGNRPERLSYSQDHWGYYNGKPNLTLLPPPLDVSLAWRFPNCTANRSPDFNSSVSGMLSKIIYPTGGMDSIVYEANDASNGGAQNIIMGGVRIKKSVTVSAINQPALVKRYYYAEPVNLIVSSGLYTGVSPYQKNIKTRYYCNDFCCEEAPQLTCAQTFGYCDHLGIYSNSLNNLFDFVSSPISYSSIIESSGDNFENGAIQYKYLTGRDAAGQILLNSDIMGAPYSNFSYLNGLLRETNVLRKNGSNFIVLKQSINTYKIDNSHTATVPAYVVNRKYDQNGLVTVSPNQPAAWEWEAFDVVQYDMMSRWIYTDTTKEITYDQDGSNPVTTTSTFYYSPQNLQLSRVESLNSKGELLKTSYTYPDSYPGSAVYDSMISRHILAPVIEQKGYVNTNNNLTITANYKLSGKLAVPGTIKRRATGTVYTEGTFDLYDNKGNLLQSTGKDGITTCYLWGYGQLYPIAKIIGTTFSTVLTKVDTAFVQKSKDDSAIRVILSNLRTISGAMATIYTYRSSVGVSSQTDPNGLTTYYEYDSYNRLYLVRDRSKNILKKFCYDYYGRPEQCNIYYNIDTNMLFTRNNCGAGYIGLPVRDTVRAGRYSSTTSQAAANQLAVNDLISNGQNYANIYGLCAVACSTTNCVGEGKKCVDNKCETGIKIYTVSTLLHGSTYNCIYHYEWSDGSWSGNVAEEHQGPCSLAQVN